MKEVGANMMPGGSALSYFVDAAVAALVVVVFWVLPFAGAPSGHPWSVAVPLAVAMLAAVLLRWRWPLAATLVALATTGAAWVLGVSSDPMIAAAWCVYPLALRADRRRFTVPAVVLVLCSGVVAMTSAGTDLAQRAVIAAGALGAAWLLGYIEGRRVAATRQVVEQAAQVDRMRTQATMAREVHDVVGHALTVISAEADVARSLPGSTEQELRESLADIEQRARGALEDVQDLVRALRSGNGRVDDHETDGAVTLLPRLVAAARVSGLDVTTSIELPKVPAVTNRVTVRIVQEALSNVVRHSGASRCEVAVWREGDSLSVRVDDDGSGLPSSVSLGHGLQGMRERVEESGGHLTIASRLDGGTRVLARLPLDVDSS